MMKLTLLLVIGVIARQTYGDEPEAIVGGNLARPGQFKFPVSIQVNDAHICGGSLISDTHIITAAHCVADPNNVKNMSVVSGTTDLLRGGERHEIKCVRPHPDYSGRKKHAWRNDIAVITLKKTIKTNPYQAPIPLANMDYATGDYKGIVCGWGLIGETLKDLIDSTLKLRSVEMNVLSTEDCMKEQTHAQTNNKHICTRANVNKGFCTGDSGSPLMVNGQLCGIVSWSKSCGGSLPDVYTNIYYYLDFIKESQNICR
ncbi:chymotrypsin-1-like [Harpegnathos saltator]|uniref:chymotrypsin-1-like n=1 Tax=Harpegnathos saltator TaxID=610380 RepID=UPI00058D0990|nr:chymotrypsin-1-like [Harpegnathos saltator]